MAIIVETAADVASAAAPYASNGAGAAAFVEQVPASSEAPRQPRPAAPLAAAQAASVGLLSGSVPSAPSRAVAVVDASAEDLGGRAMLFTFFAELADPVKKLGQTAWQARGKLASDVKAYVVLVTTTVYSMPGRASKVINNPKLQELVFEEEDPQALAAVVCGGSGAVLVGSLGGLVGATVGGASGLAVGAIPAIFTLGLSLPIGAVVGGSVGLAAGTVCGASAGAAGGATSGITVAYFRDEISFIALSTAARVYDAYDLMVVRPVDAVRSTSRRVRDSVHDGADYTKAKAKAVGATVSATAANPRVQVSVVSAATGAAALGSAGAAGGALAGAAGGALVGLVPALFTFGLSIPVGAVVGGGAGLCAGGAAGTAAGFFGGGAAGCVGYSYREVPRAALHRAHDLASRVIGKASAEPANN